MPHSPKSSRTMDFKSKTPSGNPTGTTQFAMSAPASQPKATIIPRIFGGLGNQLFCYAAARRLALVNHANLTMVELIRSCASVALHVRFFDAPYERGINNTPADYYSRAIARMELLLPDTHYFMFSDQPDFARECLSLREDRITTCSKKLIHITALCWYGLLAAGALFFVAYKSGVIS